MAKTVITHDLGNNTNKLAGDDIKGNSGGVAMPDIVEEKVKGMSRSAIMSEVIGHGA